MPQCFRAKLAFTIATGCFASRVVDGEIAAFANLEPEGGEVVVGDGFEVAGGTIAIGQIILAIDFVLPVRREGHAEAIGHGGGFELRIGAQGANGALEKLAAGVFARIRALHQGEARGIEAGVVVAIVEFRLVTDRFDLQRRRDQERRGQRDLRDDEHARDDIDQAAAIAAAALFHHLSRIASRADQCGDQPGNDGGDEGNREREDENAPIDRELPPVRRRKRRRFDDAIEHIDSPVGDERAGDRAEKGDDQALGQHLPNEPPTGRAERTANGQLFRAQGDAAELHVHHVHARDQQDDDDRAEHGPDDLAQLHAGEEH